MPQPGQIIYAGDVMWASKATEPVNNTTTMFNDLVLALPAAGTWAINGFWGFKSTPAAGFKVALVGAGGISSTGIRWMASGAANSGLLFSPSAFVITIADTSNRTLNIQGFATATAAATITLQWAQNTTDATGPTQGLLGSWLRAQRMN